MTDRDVTTTVSRTRRDTWFASMRHDQLQVNGLGEGPTEEAARQIAYTLLARRVAIHPGLGSLRANPVISQIFEYNSEPDTIHVIAYDSHGNSHNIKVGKHNPMLLLLRDRMRGLDAHVEKVAKSDEDGEE